MYKAYVIVNNDGKWLSKPFGNPNDAMGFFEWRSRNLSNDRGALVTLLK